MESVMDNVTAMNTKLVRVTPDQLRALANRLEIQARENSLPGDVVLVDFTRTITLIYDPELRFHHWKGSSLEVQASDADALPIQ